VSRLARARRAPAAAVPQMRTATPYRPSGAAAAGPNAAAASAAAIAKSRIEVVSSSAAPTGRGDRAPRMRPTTAEPARNKASATATAPYEADGRTSAATRATSAATAAMAVREAARCAPSPARKRAVPGMRHRRTMPAASGRATTTVRFAMTPPGEKLAWPASIVRIGAARTTVARVEPTSTPAATAASPPASAVVATEAISHGARPVTRTPSRSGPAGTRCATAQDSAGSTVIPVRTATATRRQDRARRRSAAGSIVTAVAKTRMTSSALMPWCAVSQASGCRAHRPAAAAATTAASSG